MKRVLIFIALFGSSFGFLLWLEGSRSSDPLDPSPGPAVSPEPGAAEPPEVPGEVDGAQGSSFALGGRFAYTQRTDVTTEGRRKIWSLVAADSARHGADEIVLSDITATLFDPDRPGVEKGILRAASGRVRLGRRPAHQAEGLLRGLFLWAVLRAPRGEAFELSGVGSGGEGPPPSPQGIFGDFELDDRVLLSDVRLTLNRGSVLEGQEIHLECERAVGRLDTGLFTSRAPARILSEGRGEGAALERSFFARGVGMRANLAEGRFHFRRDGRAELVEADGSRIALSSKGSLGAQRSAGPGEGVLVLSARGDAALVSGGDAALSITARRIEVRARQGETETRLEEALARGGVRVRTTSGEFTGERARIEAAEGGLVTTARLEGSPTASVRPAAARVLPVAQGIGSPSEDADLLEIEGSSWIDIERGAETTQVLVPGPARVAWGSSVLTADGGVRAESREGGRTATLRAWEGVRLSRPGSVCETPELQVGISLAEGEASEIDGQAQPPCRIEGRGRDGRPFVLTSLGPIAFTQSGDVWTIPLARHIEVAVGEAPPPGDPDPAPGPGAGPTTSSFLARADEVRDLDPLALSFTASGGVTLEGVRAGQPFSAEGHRLAAEGEGAFALDGDAGERAHFRWGGAQGSARHMEMQGDTLIASGEVEAEGVDGGGSWRLVCESLESSRLRDDGGAGAGAELLSRLRARGRVRGVFALGDRAFDLECGAMEVVRARLGEGARSTLWARNVERGTIAFRSEPGAAPDLWHLSAELVEAVQESDAAGVAGVQGLVARGEVEVSHQGPRGGLFRGTGETLSLDAGTARLQRGPTARVRAEGFLPESAHPFEMTAEAIELAAGRLHAELPDIDVTYLPAPPAEPGGVAPSPRPFRARSRELLASEESLLLSGDVELSGELDARPWQLSSAFARVAGRAAGEPEAASPVGSSPAGRLDAIHAWDGFVFQMGNALRASGETITAVPETGRLHVTGEPARVEYGALFEEAGWIEFDTVHNLVRSGAGAIGPRAVGTR